MHECPQCTGRGEVDVLFVDHPSAPSRSRACSVCAGRGQVWDVDARCYMEDLRGSMTRIEASRALGWPRQTWESIERGEASLGHCLIYRYTPETPAGWPSVRAALDAWRVREVS